MLNAESKNDIFPIGQTWLRQTLNLQVPEPAVASYIASGTRRTEIQGYRTLEFYPRSLAPAEDVIAHLRFALRREAFDLSILIAAFKVIDGSRLEEWVMREPTGGPSRRAWFLYETFTGEKLNLEDSHTGNYVAALDARRHVTSDRRNSPRHRVIDNLLGGAELCPTVRVTSRLNQQMGTDLKKQVGALLQHYDPAVFARAVSYLYTKETRSSFAIEGETAASNKAERFVAALRAAPELKFSKASLIDLQGKIVDSRYAATDWRVIQNFVGQTTAGYRQEIHFICPRPEDVSALMEGWFTLVRRLLSSSVDAVVAAALVAFTFVFIHPFEDGNGRIHRFLIHSVLGRRSYTPKGLIFPVSAAILRERHHYDEALETFSKPLLQLIQYRLTVNDEMIVDGATDSLYRYFDATALVEYLYDRVGDTIERDLQEELGFVSIFDRAMSGVMGTIDMPDRHASLFVRLCMQNSGRLANGKRRLFDELTDEEIAGLEAIIQEALSDHGKTTADVQRAFSFPS